MTKKKDQIGFRTPARDIQDKFEEIHNLLSEKKTQWLSLSNTLIKSYTVQIKSLGELIEGFNKEESELDTAIVIFTQILYTQNQLIMHGIAELGIENNEIHERLSRCEKLLEEIKKSR